MRLVEFQDTIDRQILEVDIALFNILYAFLESQFILHASF